MSMMERPYAVTISHVAQPFLSCSTLFLHRSAGMSQVSSW